MGIRTWIRNWLAPDPKVPAPQHLISADEAMPHNAASRVRVSIIKAINGTLLEIGVFKPNPHGPDWKYELFIVPEGMPLSQAITTVFAMKAVEE